MPLASNAGVSCYYERDGDGDPVVFVGDAGYGAWQWGWQHAAVAGPYESVVTDVRGAGRSDAPAGPYAMSDLVADLTSVLSDAGLRSATVVGAGLGGVVGLAAARTTARVDRLVCLGSAASGADLALESLYASPNDREGLERSLAAALSDRFVERHPDAVRQMVEWRAEEDAAPDAWEAQVAAIRDYELDAPYEVTAPTLVVHGTADSVWPVDRGRELAEALPRGEFVAVEDAGHLAHVERSKRVNDELLGFLADADDE
ncbi:Pimeloyl-ACP methyl ester carboxylesterase [Halogeometricum rufum]|uniref:Pimeloyl-ACP methyl ester carboxylesterase n=1 Tax=Halogeometricum rufum TaxID=553469 RepID=A0A1I6G0Q0_9EURY|nr:alpha/beta fold hydrolase [Halogeometricum rufum]SFR35637.1 Pimeloyl-ACP methyl ester carboxylesterase [Halogeometricum rufum]